MLQLIKRCPEYAEGYKSYCQEAYDHNIVFFRPSNPKYLVDEGKGACGRPARQFSLLGGG